MSQDQNSETWTPKRVSRQTTMRFIRTLAVIAAFDMLITIIALSYSSSRQALIFSAGFEKFSALVGSFGSLVVAVIALVVIALVAVAIVENHMSSKYRYLLFAVVLVLVALLGNTILDAMKLEHALAPFVIVALLVAQTALTLLAARSSRPNKKEEVQEDDA